MEIQDLILFGIAQSTLSLYGMSLVAFFGQDTVKMFFWGKDMLKYHHVLISTLFLAWQAWVVGQKV